MPVENTVFSTYRAALILIVLNNLYYVAKFLKQRKSAVKKDI